MNIIYTALGCRYMAPLNVWKNVYIKKNVLRYDNRSCVSCFGSTGGDTSRSSLFSTSNVNLLIGLSNVVRFPFLVISNWTLQTRPSLLGNTFVIFASGHRFLDKSSSWRITTSPTWLFLWKVFHFFLLYCSVKYSHCHLNQNWFVKYWTLHHRLLEYRLGRWKLPGGDNMRLVFDVSKWFGIKGSGESVSDRLSTVSGLLLTIFSASIIKVGNDSWSSWVPSSCINADSTERTVLKRRSQIPPMWEDFGVFILNSIQSQSFFKRKSLTRLHLISFRA